MADIKSVLSSIGHALKKFFSTAIGVAEAVEPFVEIAFPGVSILYNSTVAAIAHAETASIAAGAQSGTGAQKLSYVVSEIEYDYAAYASANGIKYDQSHVTAWADAIVKALNTIPAPVTP